MLSIRAYCPDDCEKLAELFYQTVHTVNARDYTKEQLDVWATGTVDLVVLPDGTYGKRKGLHERAA